MNDTKLTSVKIISELYNKFKIEAMKKEFTLPQWFQVLSILAALMIIIDFIIPGKVYTDPILNIKKERVMKAADYREFGLKCGIPIKTAWHNEEDGVFNSDNEYLRIINKARVKEIDVLEETYFNIINMKNPTNQSDNASITSFFISSVIGVGISSIPKYPHSVCS